MCQGSDCDDVMSNRGRGLFVGAELVRDRVKLTPATAEAQDIIYK